MNNDACELFFAAELKDWIHMNLQQELGRNMHMDWSGVWAMSCLEHPGFLNRDIMTNFLI